MTQCYNIYRIFIVWYDALDISRSVQTQMRLSQTQIIMQRVGYLFSSLSLYLLPYINHHHSISFFLLYSPTSIDTAFTLYIVYCWFYKRSIFIMFFVDIEHLWSWCTCWICCCISALFYNLSILLTLFLKDIIRWWC